MRKNAKQFPAGENQLYWAVLEEDDPNNRREDDNLPFQTQVMSGKQRTVSNKDGVREG
jgi:hypothetical protein